MTTIKDNNDTDDWISQAEAARIREVSKQAIAKLIARQRLPAREIGGRMLVRRADVDAFVPMPLGRPRKESAGTQAVVKKKAATKEKSD